MEVQNNVTMGMSPLEPSRAPAPPPVTPDGRPTADTVAVTKDPRPEIPLPLPANASQVGLVSKSTIAQKEADPAVIQIGPSPAERTLKPYNITLLPEKTEAPKEERPTQDSSV